MQALKDLLKTIGKYLVTVVGGTVLFLIISPVTGYVGYSDRPGPGWRGGLFEITWQGFIGNAIEMIQWGLFLAIYAIVMAVALFAVIRLLEKLRVHKIAIAIIGATLSGFLSGYIVLGIGWYIAIGTPAVTASMLLGALFGAFQLPKRRIPNQLPHNNALNPDAQKPRAG